MKRKPSNLSLKTNSNDLAGRPALEPPQSPSVPALAQRRALKHSTSSPHMLSSLKSASFGPMGGMTFPTVFERNESGLSSFLRPAKPPSSRGTDDAIMEEDSPIRSQVASRAAFDVEPYHEKESNEDKKSPGYPDGPIAIYGDEVYLYLEPSAEEARKFDVVINVAREVVNPFRETSAAHDEHMQDMSPIPDTAATEASFATAFEYIPDDLTPTTPKAVFTPKEPEYIHIPWDHNTDISTDLMHLCETIERKTLAGKKVLVHCQQGASRSASLIIAYGLYQNPELSVNDAYYAAQLKSKWISPNMRLMYCLQDFQKEVAKRKLAPNSAYKPRSGRTPSSHRMTLSVDAIEVPKEPRTAPLPDDDGAMRSTSPEKSPLRARGNSSPDQPGISPGPSSAPSAFSWLHKEDASDPGRFGRFNYAAIFTAASPVEEENIDSGFVSSSSSSCLFPKPPPSPGFAPSLSTAFPKPPPSPGFGPSDPFSKPPPSPGFGAHRFGGERTFGFTPLNLGSLSRRGSAEPPAPVERHIEVTRHVIPEVFMPDDAALMSPRAETMTSNPVHTSFADYTSLQFVEVPPTPSDPIFAPRLAQVPQSTLFSPRKTEFLRDTFSSFAARPRQISDPRSPPTKGEAPIVRSIDEML